jgi:hypothetical protein
MKRIIPESKGRHWSKKYNRWVNNWMTEYRRNGKYQLIQSTERLPNQTEYGNSAISWKMLRLSIFYLTKEYGKEEVEKELGVKIQ